MKGFIDMEKKLLPDPFKEYMQVGFEGERDVEISELSLDELMRFADADGYFTKSFAVTVKGARFKEVNILSTFAKYETESGKIPGAQLRIINSDKKTIYFSPVYEIGSKIQYYRREWRIPPTFDRFDTVRLELIIPEGVKLHLRDLFLKHNYSSYREKDIGIRYHGHGGCTTALGFQLTAELGFTSCITIPKFTKDGVGVCLHDDETVRGELRLGDGSEIAEGSKFDKPISEFTYEELLELTAKRNGGSAFESAKVPTMEEYFRICSSTGMKPVFSVHPPLTRDEWLYVRELLKKYRLLEHFSVKSNEEITHKLCLDVFGDEIGYIIIRGYRNKWTIDEFAKSVGLDKSRHKIVAEFFDLFITEETLEETRRDGYLISIAAMRGGVSGVRMQNLIDLGVSEFTLDHHCSMGLSW